MKKTLIAILCVLLGIMLILGALYFLVFRTNSPFNKWLQQNNEFELAEKPTTEPVAMVDLKQKKPKNTSAPLTPTPVPTAPPTPEPIWIMSQINPNIMNLLLVGIDTRDKNADKDKEGASDSMMLVSVDMSTGRVCIFSLMRDGMCYPWNKAKQDKINKAYSNDGINGLINNVLNGSKNYALDVQRYISINFYMFMHIIDAFGGLDVDLTEEECQFINRKIDLEIDKGVGSYMPNKTHHVEVRNGVQHLDGEQCLWYARDRYSGESADYGRTARQRTILLNLYEKVKREWTVDKMMDIIRYVADNAQTNIDATQLTQLAGIALSKDFNVQTTTIPFPDTGYASANARGQYMLGHDMKKTRERLKGIIYNGEPMPGHEQEQYEGNPDVTGNEW